MVLGSSHMDHFYTISCANRDTVFLCRCQESLFPSTSRGLPLFFAWIVPSWKTRFCQCYILECAPRSRPRISGLDSWLRDPDRGRTEDRFLLKGSTAGSGKASQRRSRLGCHGGHQWAEGTLLFTINLKTNFPFIEIKAWRFCLIHKPVPKPY